ncbi:hypothetical protein [Acidiphilium rubrum]|uniref:hypothetical protein n=1 Tax=Acidiphilium rubrum TaxID=526 RepID=UPI002C4D3DAF|nr:hypothetical protein [Acidiphilium rubrum]HQT86807.1 hypothetical protein [Acidiphilium rubrum]
MPTLTETLANRGKPASAVRSAIRADLKRARKRFYSAMQNIDLLIKIDDETVIERARPLIEAARHLPDAG